MPFYRERTVKRDRKKEHTHRRIRVVFSPYSVRFDCIRIIRCPCNRNRYAEKTVRKSGVRDWRRKKNKINNTRGGIIVVVDDHLILIMRIQSYFFFSPRPAYTTKSGESLTLIHSYITDRICFFGFWAGTHGRTLDLRRCVFYFFHAFTHQNESAPDHYSHARRFPGNKSLLVGTLENGYYSVFSKARKKKNPPISSNSVYVISP